MAGGLGHPEIQTAAPPPTPGLGTAGRRRQSVQRPRATGPAPAPLIVCADNLRGVWVWCGLMRTRWRDVGRAGELSAAEAAASTIGDLARAAADSSPAR